MLFCGKHDKDATFAYQIVETERTFTYDAAGKLLTATETEDNYGTCVYTFEYDLMGNRTYMEKALNGTVVEWHRYEYNESNQLISEKLYNGKKTTSLAYTYDADGNREHAEGQVYQSYRYSVTGEITFGAPQYENEYTYNGESYNPNIQSQYLRARYYCVVTATFLTEDSYLGSQTEPLTLNRYNYCVSSYLNYTDPSGNYYTTWQGEAAHRSLQEYFKGEYRYRYGYEAYTEYRVTGYTGSKTGIGYADIVLKRPDGVYEVYEIKPYSQKDLGGGIEQRQGYIRAMEGELKSVDRNGRAFNPNFLVLPIIDAQYNYATYYTDPSRPGMIYYNLSKTKNPKYVTAVIKQADEKKEVWGCEPFSTLTKVLNIITDTMIVERVGESILDRATQNVFPFFMLPKDMLDYMRVYPIGYEDIPESSS